MNTSQSKQLDFYYRAQQQYQKAPKPFTYELNMYSTQPKPKKFMIIINKFIEIMKEGMKEEYTIEDELKDNYWNELEKYFAPTYAMSYMIDNCYEKKKNKLRLYFGLLLHQKRLFSTIRQIVEQLDYMFENPKQKLQGLEKAFEPVAYLKDDQFQIMSEFLNDYDKFEQERREEERLQQKKREKEEKEKREQQERLKAIEQQKIAKQQEEARKKQAQDKERKEKQLRLRQQQERLKAQESKKTPENLTTSGVDRKDSIVDQQNPFVPKVYRSYFANEQTSGRLHKKSFESPSLITPYHQKNRHQKNSQMLYEERFKDEHEVFSFKLKPQVFKDGENDNKPDQNCFECKAPLKYGFYFFGGNQNQCMYTGNWFCNEHIAEERISIPWKALESFDLRGYMVSRKSYAEIKSYYEKPIIEVKADDHIVKANKMLYDFLILKRQIHLMYDSICDLELIEPILKKRLNYCIKMNLFSLKNLYDIYNGHEGPSLQREYEILSKHFYRCEKCQKRKGYICAKCKDSVRIFAFELRDTHGCTSCRKMFHRKCLVNGKCDCTQE